MGINFEVPETGSTFQENAIIKATSYADRSGILTLSDDSGLEVEALAGEPGVFSSRYAGNNATDSDRINLLLHNLGGVLPSKRHARFKCVVALAQPGEAAEVVTGTCCGTIAMSPRGDNGFGYDPVFLLNGVDRTMAELTQGEKNLLSHRGKAIKKVIPTLKFLVSEEI